MSDTITITLSRPITHDEKTVASLTFREATAGDACGADAVHGDFTKILAVLAGMSGTPLPLIKKIPLRDINTIIAKVGPLMGEQPAAAGST
jgi:hypothetical protein